VAYVTLLAREFFWGFRLHGSSPQASGKKSTVAVGLGFRLDLGSGTTARESTNASMCRGKMTYRGLVAVPEFIAANSPLLMSILTLSGDSRR
jgi:hypothetical protein